MKKIISLTLLICLFCSCSNNEINDKDKTEKYLLTIFSDDKPKLITKSNKNKFYQGNSCILNYINTGNTPIALSIYPRSDIKNKNIKKVCFENAKKIINKIDYKQEGLFNTLIETNKNKFKYRQENGFMMYSNNTFLIVFNQDLYQK